MLRSNILQPPTLYESFMAPRYEAVEELTINEEMFLEIRKGTLIHSLVSVSLLTSFSFEKLS